MSIHTAAAIAIAVLNALSFDADMKQATDLTEPVRFALPASSAAASDQDTSARPLGRESGHRACDPAHTASRDLYLDV